MINGHNLNTMTAYTLQSETKTNKTANRYPLKEHFNKLLKLKQLRLSR